MLFTTIKTPCSIKDAHRQGRSENNILDPTGFKLILGRYLLLLITYWVENKTIMVA